MKRCWALVIVYILSLFFAYDTYASSNCGLPEEGKDLLLQAQDAFSRGDYSKARGLFEKAFLCFQEFGSVSGQMLAAFYLGLCSYRLLDLGLALDWYRKALSLSSSSPTELEARTHLELGRSYLAIGQCAQASTHLEKAMEIFRKLGVTAGGATAELLLGEALWACGEYSAAGELFEEAAHTFKELEDLTGEVQALTWLGRCSYEMQSYREAMEYFRRALKLSQAMGWWAAEARIWGCIGLCYYALGEYEHTLDAFGLSKRILSEIGDRLGLAQTAVWLGDSYCDLGSYEEALRSYEEALTLYRDNGNRWGSFLVLLRIASLEDVFGSFKEVLARYREALGEVGGFPAPSPQLARVRLSLYEVLIAHSGPEESLLYAEGLRETKWLDMVEGALLSCPETLPESSQALRYALLKLLCLYRTINDPVFSLEMPVVTPDILREAEGEYRKLLSAFVKSP